MNVNRLERNSARSKAEAIDVQWLYKAVYERRKREEAKKALAGRV